MDLIYMNQNFEDLGVLHDYTFDLAFGTDENDFECKMKRKNHCCNGGFYLYIEGTEYGGIIDTMKSDTKSDEITYYGRTWHGILDSKCIVPLMAGETSTADVTIQLNNSSGSYVDKYLIVSGEANKVIAWLINRLGLSDLFVASTDDSGIEIKKYKFNRYVMGYEGIMKMLKASKSKLKFNFENGKVVLKAERSIDYSLDELMFADKADVKISRTFNSVNHLICLGKSELDQREVIHLYTDANGNISETQILTGKDEVAEVYENTSSEDLEADGIAKLKELWNADQVNTDFDSNKSSYDVGDSVGASDYVTGIEATATITKKIVTINKGRINISYKVGE